jgi:TatD DNase family protein
MTEATPLVWTDSHCHLQYDGVSVDAIAGARAARVTRIVCVGTDLTRSEQAISLAREHDGVWATAGVHPHDAAAGLDGIEELLGEAEVVAVGECGLDYHYDHSPRDVQRRVFAAQVGMARAHGLALVVHSREAWDDTFAILRAEGVPERTVFHCFTGGPEEAGVAVGLGAYLSFSGIVTFRNAGDVREAAARCPADRLLIETDAPYLAPVPHRGKPNQPAFLPAVGTELAMARGTTVAEIAAITWENAERVFRLGS